MSHRPLPRPPQRAARLPRHVGGLDPARGPRRVPRRSPAPGRPAAIAGGVQTGRRDRPRLPVWVRADRPARMIMETAATESFRNPRRWHGPLLGAPARTSPAPPAARSCPPASRSTTGCARRPDDPRRTGEPVTGTFRTVSPAAGAACAFLWSGDPGRPGLRGHQPRPRRLPDLRRHGPARPGLLPVQRRHRLRRRPDQRHPGAARRRHLAERRYHTEEKAKVAETLAEYRGNFRYNLLDRNLRRFNAQVPSIVQWDDHEVRNNLVPGRDDRVHRHPLHREEHRRPRGARTAGVQRVLPFSTLRPGAKEGRVHRVLARRLLAGRVSARHAHLTATPTRPTTRPPIRRASSAGSSWSGSSGTGPVAGGVEGARRRHAAGSL
ncbi:alkaline phosphatase D family protein [Streptomyces tricolor]|nr:alkaline phosphatase D family protein [Streptomyces tricolor]